MTKLTKNASLLLVAAGLSFAVIGLVMQTFADTAGLYCFAAGAVLILAFIAYKVIELDRE